MLCKQLLILIVSIELSRSQNILNFLDFAAPLFGLLKTGTPEVCYNELGCFRNDGPFIASEHRPISCVPQSPQLIGTEFLFYSRSFPDEPQVIEAIDSHLYNELDFKPDKPTKIVVHGYKEGLIIQGFAHVLNLFQHLLILSILIHIYIYIYNHLQNYIQLQETFEIIKDGLLYNEDANIILVRWNRGASGFYFQAVANCRLVAAQIAKLITYLIVCMLLLKLNISLLNEYHYNGIFEKTYW